MSHFKKVEVSTVVSSGEFQNAVCQAADASGGGPSSDGTGGAAKRGGGFHAGFGFGFGFGVTMGLQMWFHRRRPRRPKPGGRPLLSRGEQVEILAADGTTWVPVFDALLDTGNEARTVISSSLASRLGLQPLSTDVRQIVQMRGTNGWSSPYQRCQFRLRISDVETGIIDGAIGGRTSVLVGKDVLKPLGDLGYSVRVV